jgi:hypothetical protein
MIANTKSGVVVFMLSLLFGCVSPTENDAGVAVLHCDAATKDCSSGEDVGGIICEQLELEYNCRVGNALRCKDYCKKDDDCEIHEYGVTCPQDRIIFRECGRPVNKSEVFGIQDEIVRFGEEVCRNDSLQCISTPMCAYIGSKCELGRCTPILP